MCKRSWIEKFMQTYIVPNRNGRRDGAGSGGGGGGDKGGGGMREIKTKIKL